MIAFGSFLTTGLFENRDASALRRPIAYFNKVPTFQSLSWYFDTPIGLGSADASQTSLLIGSHHTDIVFRGGGCMI